MRSPAVILYDAAGSALAVADGVAIPVGTPGLILAGKDGSTSRFAKVDAQGRLEENIGGWFGATTPTVGQKAMATSIPVTISSDQTPLATTLVPAGGRTGVAAGRIVLGGSTAGTLQVLRATTYSEPTVAAQRSIASTSAADTAAGTGARTVEITYYDGVGAGPLTEIITLNGTAPVDTVNTDIRFIERMDVVTAGSGGANAGVITLFVATAGGGGTVGTIGVGNAVTAVGDNSTFWAHHYAVAGSVCQLAVVVCGIVSGGSGTNGTFFARVKYPLVADSAEVVIGDQVLVIGAFERSFDFHPTVTGFARIVLYVIPGTNNTTVAAAFDWTEVP